MKFEVGENFVLFSLIVAYFIFMAILAVWGK
jgi:hypothetical protein